GNVSLAPQNPPQDFVLCSWYRSATAAETSRILTCFPHTPLVQQNGPAHTGLETAGPGCALHITGLTLNDTGNYTVQIQSPTSPGLGTVVLRVYGKCHPGSCGQSPSPPSVPIEPGAVTLRCEAGGSPVSYNWFKDNEIVKAGDHVPLSSDNQTVMLDPGSRNDLGSYTCLPPTLPDPSHNVVGRLHWNLPHKPTEWWCWTPMLCGWRGSTHGNALSAPCTEMLPRPTVTPNQTLVLENKTFTLRCNSSPSADTVLWLRDGASLASSDRLVLSSDNRTLKVLNVTRGDAGAYQCEVGNPVSSIRSEPGTVTVAYGPESARIEPSELLPQLLGSLVHLTCVSESVPAPHYRWVLNSTELKGTGSSLTLNLTSLDQQGMYMCQAQNPITSLTKNSTSLVIQVQGELPGTAPYTLFSLRHPENLGSPSADTVLWLRDGASLVPSDRLVLSPDNRTLTVLGVTRDDAGAYQCEVRNPVSTKRSEPGTVTLAYGPESVRIDPPGPITLTLGSPLTLTCVADSIPAPSYRWGLNGTDTNQTGSSLTFNPMTLDHQGTYECRAHNPITNRTVSVCVTARFPTSPLGLSPGAIAGIVIGSLAGAVLLGGLLYFLLRKTEG
uniref:Ig-like domain-containing protein n=1 Tax=Gopherus evgoodei TaxID=1825980 RepID=A0A8C4YJD7_9SAUR